jgi:hypothetical protein
VRHFTCSTCDQQLVFENSRCLSCGSALAFDLNARNFAVVDRSASTQVHVCGNRELAACNWRSPAGADALCASCKLTRVRPPDFDPDALAAFAEAEAAKRRLIFELAELKLPVRGRDVDAENGLCFDLLSSKRDRVITGHANGVITLDLAESNDVHREQLRVSMDEPYRTLLGHFRHEIGHYYFAVLVRSGSRKASFEGLFGDPDRDYQAALDRHYEEGPPATWSETFVSAYASMHPAEDWAETFAHYLHIRDTLDTAAAFGFAPKRASLFSSLSREFDFEQIIESWLPLAWSLNMVNRSMGHPDLYPFVLPPLAIKKLAFVHELIGTRTAM